MMNDVLPTLLLASAVVGAVIVLLLALRGLLQRTFGVQLTYLAWSAVPIALLMALLPLAHSSRPMLLVMAPLQQLAAQGTQPLRAALTHGTQWPQWVVLAWLAGTAATLLWFWHDHLRYRYSLGPLRQEDGVSHCIVTQEGPAVVGLWRPMIIVLNDFSTRYTAQEQQLILAHETIHARRRDPVLNCLCALLQSVFWFHPLVHLGARRFRLDQELACDAAVMLQHPGQRRSYAEAMLKTQLSTQSSLIHCHWQSRHPLKERIMQLQHNPPQALHKLIGRLFVSALVAGCGYASLAAHADVAPAATLYQIDIKMTAGSEESSPRIQTAAGVPFSVVSKGAHGTWRSEFVLEKVGEHSVLLKTVFKHDERVLGQPTVQFKLGEEAAIAMQNDNAADNLKLRLTVVAAKP